MHYYLVEAADDPSQVLLRASRRVAWNGPMEEEIRRVITALEKDEVE